MGEAFFGEVAAWAASAPAPEAAAALYTEPADPVAKAVARNSRRGGDGQVEAAEKPCAA